jgi:hypothetical protein
MDAASDLGLCQGQKARVGEGPGSVYLPMERERLVHDRQLGRTSPGMENGPLPGDDLPGGTP